MLSLAADGVDLVAGVSLDELLAATVEIVEAEVSARVEGVAASGDDDGGGGGRSSFDVGDTLKLGEDGGQ